MHMTIYIVIMLVNVSVVAMHVTVSRSNLIFLSLIPIFHKIDQKTSEGRRHHIIIPLGKYSFKLKILVGRIYIKVG